MTHASEIDRIREAYRERDAGATPSIYTWTNPGYVFHMQDLEWQVLAALRRHGSALDGKRVLEVGCGFGAILQRLKDFGASEAVGIDLAENRVEAGRRRYPALDLHVGDGAAMPFADASFDVVTQFVALSSVLDAEVRRGIAAEMWRVLKPGGLALSYDLRVTPRTIRFIGRASARARGIPQASSDAGTPTTPITADELRSLFPNPEIRTVTLNFELAGLAARSVVLARLLASLPLLQTHHLAIARKPAQ